MTIGGWITMILSVGFVTTLFIWSVSRVLTGVRRDHTLAHIEPLNDDEVAER